MKLSIVIRTYNEATHIGSLLKGIADQQVDQNALEVIVVDSGSTDGTLQIAESSGVRILHIKKDEFSFGRSLNVGCAAARGDVLVFVSGHCVPASRDWLTELITPLGKHSVAYSYGRQMGNEQGYMSECRIFAKYFPPDSRIPQEGFYCNNANSALLKTVWQVNRFDEELTGLEDMHLAKSLIRSGHKIAYVASAPVFHIHNETWAQVKRRFEREAIALQHIMPEIHVSLVDCVRYWISAASLDLYAAYREGALSRRAREIVLYRLMQYWGAYRGNHIHRKLSKHRKEAYYYPR